MAHYNIIPTKKHMKTKSNTTRERLGTYLTAAIGAGTLAGTADAAIVTLDISAFGGPNANLPDRQSMIVPLLPGNFMSVTNNRFGQISGVGADWSGPLNLAMKADGSGLFNFGTGAVIGASAKWNSDYNYKTYFKYSGTTQPAWEAGSCIGFQANSATTPLYGWLKVTWAPLSNTFEFLSGAYENSGAPILAGVSVVPEPASALSTMGLLASGLLIRRRKVAA